MTIKNLDSINTNKIDVGTDTGEVYLNTENSGKNTSRLQGAAGKEEQETRMADGKTQGRKGCHAPRINLAFTSTNYDFVKVMSCATGETMTDFINFVLDQYREEHHETYDQAKAFTDALTNKTGSK